MSRLGDTIRAGRIKNKMTEKALAKKCGLAESFIKDVESGRKIVSDEQAQRILKVLGVVNPVSTELEVAAEPEVQLRPKPRPYIIPVEPEERKLTAEEKKQAEETAQTHQAVLDFVKETLGEKAKEVRISKTLRSHPVCLVPEAGMSFEMEKYMKRVNPEFAYESGRILELNASHPVFAAMEAAMETDKEKAEKYAKLLWCQALLIADLPLENPTEYTDLVCSLMI